MNHPGSAIQVYKQSVHTFSYSLKKNGGEALGGEDDDSQISNTGVLGVLASVLITNCEE